MIQRSKIDVIFPPAFSTQQKSNKMKMYKGKDVFHRRRGYTF